MNTRLAEPNEERGRVSALRRDGVLDYQTVVEPRLPVLEESITQLRPGPPAVDVAVVASDKVWAISAQIHASSVGVTIMDPAFVAFLSWAGADECHVNGELARPTNIYMPGAQGGFHIHGGRRETIGVAFCRNQFIDTVAALRGIGPEDVTLDARALELAPRAAAGFRARLVELLDQSWGGGRSAQPVV